jgi:hypothetical protein
MEQGVPPPRCQEEIDMAESGGKDADKGSMR